MVWPSFCGGREGRDEPDLVEAALLARLLGEDEVADVDRVEGAAEDADAHGPRP